MCGPQGFMDVLGDRWNGVSGDVGASNGSHGPHDVNKCNIGVGKFNIKLPLPSAQNKPLKRKLAWGFVS